MIFAELVGVAPAGSAAGRGFRDQPALRQRVAQDDQHFVVLERLADVVVGAALHRRDRVLDRRERGDHQHRQVVVDAAYSSSAATPSMPGIIMSTIAASNGIERASSSPSRRGEAEADLVALARQERLEDLAHDLLVVDDENRVV